MSWDEIRRVEWIAGRAPSPHNTQPWRLVYEQDRIRLDYDPSRHLKESDPQKRDLLLALGGFVESLLIASREARVGLQFIPDMELQSCRIGWFYPASDLYTTPFTSDDVLKRQTSRLIYRPARMDAALERAIRGVLSPADRIMFVQGSAVRDLLGTADRHLLDTADIASEFRQWSRLKPAEIASSRDGMTAQCLALNRLEAQVLSALLSDNVYPWFRRLRLSAIVSGVTRRLVAPGADLIALVRPARDPFQALDAGRSLLRLWLTLGRAELHAQPLSQVLDCPETAARIAARLQPGVENEILCLFRFGISNAAARSRRLGDMDRKS